MQSRQARWPWVLVAVAVVAAGVWLFRRDVPGAAGQPSTPAANTAPPAAAPAVEAPPAAPAIRHPVDPTVAADAALPALADSDAAAWDALVTVFGDAQPLGVLLRDHLIARIVVMVDNLTQPSLTPRVLAFRPLPDTLRVADDGQGGTTLDAANAQRYAPYVQAFAGADATAWVAAYQRLYPLFQQAYVELGYPKGYFNDRLVAVIDHLLQAPEPVPPLAVAADGRGRYRFVDPALQSLSVGQKALVRLGPEQAAAVKAQLRALRAALTRG